MRKVVPAIALLLFCFNSFSQLLSWSPEFPIESTTSFTITVDASKGNQGLFNYANTSDVYVHTGVITNLSTSSTNWRYVKFNQVFSVPNPALQATYIGSNRWQITFPGDIRSYYGVPGGETILKIAILFRSGNGSLVQRNANGSDMYIPVYTTALAARINVPYFQPTYVPVPETITKNVGDNIAITGVANISSTMKIYLNGSVIHTLAGATTISANPVLTMGGNQEIVVEAFDGITTKKDTVKFFINAGVVIESLPAGIRDGINYEADNTAATLVLYAPSKSAVSVIGDLPGSNWTDQAQYQLKKTPDGNYWWLRLTGLAPGFEYSFQYLVDGVLKVADPYAEKIQDPYNDQFISPTTYPGLKPYPAANTTGMVSILQTASVTYNWRNNTFTRPDKRNLLIYELIVRDFVAAHDWKTMRDTLDYIKRLGINTIEIMPFNEFEGNISWGYNPDYYFAPDKYYGPKNTLKEFIDSAHSRGIAVVMDIALNHSFGLSSMVQLYWDAANNRPAANNPWFNTVAKHAFNVGYDINHESLATRYFTSRVIEHWLTEYKIDGFRFDLSKGFTQTQTCDGNGNNCDVGAWSNYDASRIAIWKRYYDTMQLKSNGSYAILEHFANNSEEIELSNYGMLLWGNMHYNYGEASMGFVSNSNLDNGLFISRGWSQPHLITYMESHDEERIMYQNLNYGNSNAGYNIRDFNTALKRMELTGAFLLTQPGPKMIYEFGELGYEYSINYCQNGTINNGCRTDPKPIRWDYLANANRKHLHDVYRALMLLRANPLFRQTFITGFINRDLSGAFKWLTLSGAAGKLVVIGNFEVVQRTGSVTFPSAGTWYNFFTGATFNATGASQSFTLEAGEYHVFLNTNVVIPVRLVNFSGRKNGSQHMLTWEVTNELNVDRYEIERSIDGRNFYLVSSQPGTGGTAYQYNDNVANVSASIYYYRLKSIDRDGQYSYSPVVKLKGDAKNWLIEAGPNPFRNIININIDAPAGENAELILSDISGRRLLNKSVSLSSGNNAYEIKEVSGLSAGTYFLTIITGQGKQTLKLVRN